MRKGVIKKDPTSRRIFMSSWNPVQLDIMALPPCHVSYQFYVTDDKKLSCMMYQLSGDIFMNSFQYIIHIHIIDFSI